MEELEEALEQLQANVVALYAQSHGYHWNVRGIVFKELHAFFLEIYEDVFDSIDVISEDLRKLGYLAPFGLQTWAQAQTINANEDPNLSAVQMLNELIRTNLIVIDNIAAASQLAQTAGEQGILNDLADRDGKHKFWDWQLKATVQTFVS